MTAQETIKHMLNNGYSEKEIISQAEHLIIFAKELEVNLKSDWQGVLDILKPKKLENITKVTK